MVTGFMRNHDKNPRRLVLPLPLIIIKTMREKQHYCFF